MNEVIPGLYIGSAYDAADDEILDLHNIKFIVNCAIEVPNLYPNKIKYLNLNLQDDPKEDIFDECSEAYYFIEKGLSLNSGVLVHCHAGISRAAAVVAFFLMNRDKKEFDEVLVFLKLRRTIVNPNKGYATQLKNIQWSKIAT